MEILMGITLILTVAVPLTREVVMTFSGAERPGCARFLGNGVETLNAHDKRRLARL